MTLRARLLLISLLLLSLPLAGWQLVRSLEQALRESYQQTLVDTAAAAASELSLQAAALPGADSIYVHRADHDIVVDGHAGDWAPWLDAAQPLARIDADPSTATIIAAARGERLHVLIRVVDRRLILADPKLGPGDHVRLEVVAAERSSDVEIAPMAPGWIESAGGGRWPLVHAAMQPGDNGWTMEMSIERPRAVTALGVDIVDVNDPVERRAETTHSTTGARPLAKPSPDLSGQLAALLPEHTRGWVTGPTGWVAARAAASPQPASPESGDESWLLATIAARALGMLPTEAPDRHSEQDLIGGDEMGDEASARWYRQAGGEGFLVSAAAPIRHDGRVAGYVVIERRADRFMARAYRSLLQLFVFGFVSMLVMAAVLIGFAARLSARIRRLRDAAESAVTRDGRVHTPLAAPKGADEVADLGRSLAGMVDRQRQHQDYLRTLASKLSHELRTPLAMIRSSLENLSEEADPESRERYRQRAQAGCHRLQQTFQAMSQAARIEESLGDEPLVELDLAELVERYTHGCAQAFEKHRFSAVVPGRSRACIAGSAEQLAQLLDKLVENAVEFTPAGRRITLRVVPRGREISLQVDNPGSKLPEGESGRLFDSMVSSRSSGDEAVHLGLGLHVVRLIAQRHGAHVRALDTPDGVRFQVDFPRFSQPGSSGQELP